MDNTPVGPEPRRFGGLGKRGALLATTLGLATGGFAGGYLVSHAASSASPSPAPSGSSTSSGSSSASSGTGSGTTAPGAPSGTFTPNEDLTHEAGESAAREAQENAGQRPTVP
jgi:hypothetical protein